MLVAKRLLITGVEKLTVRESIRVQFININSMKSSLKLRYPHLKGLHGIRPQQTAQFWPHNKSIKQWRNIILHAITQKDWDNFNTRYQLCFILVRFEVLTAATMKTSTFWDVTSSPPWACHIRPTYIVYCLFNDGFNFSDYIASNVTMFSK